MATFVRAVACYLGFGTAGSSRRALGNPVAIRHGAGREGGGAVGDKGWDAIDDAIAAERSAERLRALSEYAELRNRWLLGKDQPGDRKRRPPLRAILERTGGVPETLQWPRHR
jgi:hypothetical protein